MSYLTREIVQFGLSGRHKITKPKLPQSRLLRLMKYTLKLPQYFI